MHTSIYRIVLTKQSIPSPHPTPLTPPTLYPPQHPDILVCACVCFRHQCLRFKFATFTMYKHTKYLAQEHKLAHVLSLVRLANVVQVCSTVTECGTCL